MLRLSVVAPVRNEMRPSRRDLALILAAPLLAPAGAFAQAPSTGLRQGDPPKSLELTPAQRQLIYASISRQTHQSTAAPSAFQPEIGGTLPEAIELTALPETIVEVVPQTRGHAYAFVGGQVLIVEPTARRIIEIVAQSST
jgi:hypothetical protein